MNAGTRTAAWWLLWGAAGLAALAGVAAMAGVRVNTTASFPLGLYRETGEKPAVGALVLSCPPPGEDSALALGRGYIGPGFCPGGYGYVIKKLVAGPGDRVTVTDSGVTVNGEPLPNSAPFAADPSGRPLPRYRTAGRTLLTGEVLLLSDYHPRSFDGRYFGPVGSSGIRAVIRPLWTW